MVAPYRHTAEYELLSDEEMLEMHRLGGRCISVLKKVMNPQGFNLGINLGKVAGAGFDGHLHLHIVPGGTATRISCPCLPMSVSWPRSWRQPMGG